LCTITQHFVLGYSRSPLRGWAALDWARVCRLAPATAPALTQWLHRAAGLCQAGTRSSTSPPRARRLQPSIGSSRPIAALVC